MLEGVGFLLLAALLWGGTNPFIKRGSAGLAAVKEPTRLRQAMSELRFLLCRPQYLVPQVLNLCGSAAFFYSLRTVDLSLASVVCNSLTFLLTFLVGILLGEKPGTPTSVAGMVLVAVGVSVCIHAKS
eukprot:TRINITY_DN43744_c0_g1_i1.p1 TRINITY_DN43744_c0_g1~~TRINITY_DN43744_c0_g1_i1.p1  ORF type:complete len:135 (-),score=11.94 TRINITY_DN43744_c0_g1_i1:80-463(-)